MSRGDTLPGFVIEGTPVPTKTEYPKHIAILPRPLAAQPKIRVAKDTYVEFKSGRAKIESADQEMQVRDALRIMRIRVFDENLERPSVIKSIGWATYSQEAYEVANDRLPRS